ncbi:MULTISPECIES: LysR family transcriptional regulator [Streptomyces]|uniref:LysR family transcriptional regulator n=1 Tax=Streptomyces lycopersici TaxID=2974589 RepID=UPI0021D21207|nr:LysR substrate-binding domain-containing protein [Streptomyces sp. NEAU-383]
MNLDTALLRSFVVLADELHFARAAERLHLEQPALSQRIKRLERRVGAKLFVRDTRNVRLTPAGAGFLADVSELLDRLDDAVVRAREVEAGSRGTVRVAYTLSVGYETLPVLFGSVQERLPDLSFEAIEMWEKDVLDAVRRRTWDIGLVRCNPDDPGIASVLIRNEPLILAVPSGHGLAGRTSVRMAELSGERFVITPSSLAPGYQGLIEKVFATAGFSPDTVGNPVPGSRVMAVLRRERSVALLPASARHVHPEGVEAFIPITDDFAKLPVRMLHRENPGPAVRLLVETVQQAAREQKWL